MKIDVDLSDGTCWTIIVCFIITAVMLAMTFSYLGKKADTEVQLTMAEKGYSPIEISCAYNINAPLCIQAGSGVN